MKLLRSTGPSLTRAAAHLRRQFRRAWHTMDLCAECSYAYEGGSLSSETIAEAVWRSLEDEPALAAPT